MLNPGEIKRGLQKEREIHAVNLEMKQQMLTTVITVVLLIAAREGRDGLEKTGVINKTTSMVLSSEYHHSMEETIQMLTWNGRRRLSWCLTVNTILKLIELR